jgi:ABC-type nickel/cobalt efflux system permease component RcnA
MDQTLSILFGAAITVGFIHTLIGIDHSLPFIMIARAQHWSWPKLLTITTLCGVGHVLSSVVLGLVGISLGVAVERLNLIEARRGELASWLLIGFGLAYAAWAVYRTLRGRPHTHVHTHDVNQAHAHEHQHEADHLHPHGPDRRALTIWTLFIIFVFGPCEPLIPLLMVPAFEHHWAAVALVAGVFGTITIGTMLALVAMGYYGLRRPAFAFLERHVHTVAGLTIAASGGMIKLLGI